MSARPIAEVAEARAARANPPLCPVCGTGNLAGSWTGPLGVLHSRDLTPDERGEWRWECEACGESGPWVPVLAHGANPFVQGRALYDPEGVS